MSVYVDDVRHPYGKMIMCHLWADTLDELLAMVDTIGVNRKWIQGHAELSFGHHRRASWVHFDIALSKKHLAIAHGAILTDRYGPLVHTRRLKLALALEQGNAEEADRCRHMLDTIERLRAR